MSATGPPPDIPRSAKRSSPAASIPLEIADPASARIRDGPVRSPNPRSRPVHCREYVRVVEDVPPTGLCHRTQVGRASTRRRQGDRACLHTRAARLVPRQKRISWRARVLTVPAVPSRSPHRTPARAAWVTMPRRHGDGGAPCGAPPSAGVGSGSASVSAGLHQHAAGGTGTSIRWLPPTGTSKYVAIRTRFSPLRLNAVWALPCPGSTNAFPAG